MKVYVVTSGEYSGYRIEGVFSTRAKAQEYKNRQAASLDGGWTRLNDIEVWEVDQEVAAVDHSQWHVGIMLDDGSVKERQNKSRRFGIPKDEVYTHAKVPAYGGRGIVRAVSITSAAHAMKLAVEARQAWLRKKAGA